jgi:hypothetical protein
LITHFWPETDLCWKYWIVLNWFHKFPYVISCCFNVWRKIIENLDGRVVHYSLVHSKSSYGLMKIIGLSCIFSMILWIKNKKILVFYHKKHKWEDILRYKCRISNLLNRFLHEVLLLHPIVILFFFLILNVFILWGEFLQKGKP